MLLQLQQVNSQCLRAPHPPRRHDYNDYQLQLKQHIEERDALLNKIDRTSQRLQLLKNTNVYNDAFKIWCAARLMMYAECAAMLHAQHLRILKLGLRGTSQQG